MSGRPTQHLADVVRKNGPAAGSRFISTLLETGLELERQKEQEQRAAAGKTVNPYFTMTEKCVRQSFFTLTEEPPSNPLDVNSLTNFKVGHAIEEAFGSIIAWASGGDLRREISMEFEVDGIRISGRLDFALPLLEENILIELKATNRFAIKKMLETGEMGRSAHRGQLNMYLHAAAEGKLDEAFGRPVRFDLAYLVYIVQGATKGEPVCHAFPVEYNRQKAEGDLVYLAQLGKMAKAGEDPGIPTGFTKSYWECRYCSYTDRCHTPGFGQVAS